MPRKERITPGLGIAPTVGRPSQGARDPFVQFTGNAASQPLRDLARSLSRFGEQGARFASRLQQQRSEEQAEKGRQAFLQALEEQKDTAKAIAALELRPQQSKWFRFGVQSAAGKQDAMRARDHFYATMKDRIEEAETLEDFDALVSESLEDYREGRETSEAFDNGFFPSYMAMIENGRFEFARGLDGKLSQQKIDDFQATSMSEARFFLNQGGTVEALGAEFTRQLDVVFDFENPLLNEDLQKAVVENLKALAEDEEDSSILDVAKQISIGKVREDGTRLTLWDRFSQGSDGLSASRARIISQINSRELEREAQERRADAAQLEAIEGEILTALTEGGRGSFESSQALDELLLDADRISATSGAALRQVIVTREGFTDNTVQDTFARIQVNIWEGRGSVGEIINNMDELSAQAARTLHSDLQAYQNSLKSGSSENSVLSDPRVMDFVTGISGRLGVGPLSTLTADKGNRIAVAKAQLRQTIARNADLVLGMSLPDREVWLAKQQDIVIGRNLGSLQGQLGGEEGIEETPMISGPQLRSSDQELDAAFTTLHFIQMEEWINLYGQNLSTSDVKVQNFSAVWNRMVPDAPVGSDEFIIEWMRLRDRAEARLRQPTTP